MGMPVNDAVVKFCETPKSRKEIAAFLGENLTHVIARYINPLIESERMFYTIPHIPQTPHQRFVNESGKRYIKTEEVILEFCRVPRSSLALGKFINIDKTSALKNYITPFLESGKLSRIAPEGSSHQKYINAEMHPPEDTLFIAEFKNQMRQKYCGRIFMIEDIIADFGVTLACAYRRIGRLVKRGWLSYERRGKAYGYTIKEKK